MKKRRRRNADDDIRKLERIAFQTEEPEDIERYWRASLRAGEIPKPTIIQKTRRGKKLKGTTHNLTGGLLWILRPKEYQAKNRDIPRLLGIPAQWFLWKLSADEDETGRGGEWMANLSSQEEYDINLREGLNELLDGC